MIVHLPEYDLEDLLNVDRLRGRGEDQRRLHSLGKLACLIGDLLLLGLVE